MGSGKTTVCRRVTAGLHPGLHRVYYVSLTTGNVLDIYKSIARELGLAEERSRATAYRAIRNEVTRLVQESTQLPVLIVDEAQHLRNDVLEYLRLLTNFSMDAERRLCVLLVGLTELRRRLSMAVHESLSQRWSSAITSAASAATRSTATSPTACVLPAPSCPCSSRPPSRRCSRPPADCRGASTASPTTPCRPPRSPSNAPSTPSTCSTLSTNSARSRTGRATGSATRATAPAVGEQRGKSRAVQSESDWEIGAGITWETTLASHGFARQVKAAEAH